MSRAGLGILGQRKHVKSPLDKLIDTQRRRRCQVASALPRARALSRLMSRIKVLSSESDSEEKAHRGDSEACRGGSEEAPGASPDRYERTRVKGYEGVESTQV